MPLWMVCEPGTLQAAMAQYAPASMPLPLFFSRSLSLATK